MKRVLLFVLFGALAALAARDECGPCDPDACRTPDSCLAGLVKDACGCCMVCGQREGHRCYHRSVAGSWEHGPCGEDLDCRPRADLAPGDPAEALCVCNKAWPMCGSDGVTYDSVCQLTEARYSRRDGLEAASRGPCMAGEVHLVEERASGEKPLPKRFVSVKRRTMHFHI
ncbi:Kazal-type serine protease inhibitor domain containing protein [Ixodes scapularis]